MSERLQIAFQQAPAGRTRLITYLMAGDPDPEISLSRLEGLATAGVDILEVGIPFSDPTADGPVIQSAALRALEESVTVKKCLELVRKFRVRFETPVLFMSYLNPLLQYGFEKFVRDAVDAGVDGLILPDLPWQEGQGLRGLTAQLVGQRLAFIPMIAQTSQPQDIKALGSGDLQGFAYVLSRNGITGGEAAIPSKVLDFLGYLRQDVKLPLCIGFGIQKAEQVERLAPYVDGVVVGSALVQRFYDLDRQNLSEMERKKGEQEIFAWVSQLKGL